MEIGIKENILAFNKGVTNSPSDIVCEDGCLEACEGLVSVDGELKVVQGLKEMQMSESSLGKLMYVHRLNNGWVFYIYYGGDGLHAYDRGDGADYTIDEDIDGVTTVTAVGNTLIAVNSSGLNYYLWDSSTMNYKSLGSRIPDIVCNIQLGESVSKTQRFDGYVYNIISGGQSDINNMFVGNYSKAKAEVEESGAFTLPFFACMAIEMYDGTYTHMTAPVLLLPNIVNGSENRFVYGNDGTDPIHLDTSVSGGKIAYKMTTDYSDWKDIVKDVHIFVTRGVNVSDLNDDCKTQHMTQGTIINRCLIERKLSTYYAPAPPSDVRTKSINVVGIPARSEADIVDDLKNERVFYKLTAVEKTDNNGKLANVDKYTIKNIETQDQLSNIEYYSHCDIIPEGVATFNRRLNVWGVKRGFFDGFSQFNDYTCNDNAFTTKSSKDYKIYVHIKGNNGNRIVCKSFNSQELFYENMWFYYPDPRAYKVEVYMSNGSQYLKMFEKELKEHPGFNGAYCLGGLPDGTESKSGGTSVTEPTTNYQKESLGNYLLQSGVDNPFTFNASGYVRVGQGRILGLAGLTTALSQDAYKVATTIAFTTQGIWALQIDGEGQYSQIPPPFSREVCKSPESITMTDGAVFFVSEKGLMCVTGTTEDGVICVSEQLQGKGFGDFYSFLNGCRIAYDYRDSLLYVVKPNSASYWVFNIKGRTWSTVSASALCGNVQTVVGDYPDNIVQTSNGKCYSVLEKPVRDLDKVDNVDKTYTASFESRALKLDGSLVLKSLRQVKALKMLSDGATMTVTIKGSNDLKTWTSISSRRGKSWRFFKVKVAFANMKANDTFSGMMLVTQGRYTNKVR